MCYYNYDVLSIEMMFIMHIGIAIDEDSHLQHCMFSSVWS